MDILEEIDVFLSACQLTQDESNKLVFNGITGCFESKYLADWFVNQINFGWKLWQAAKARAVPEVAQRQGGYYIRDLRSQPGNCMKFWYQAGYGTKHKNFFWCATLEEAKEYKGGCDWFEIWHAPYIDSLVEYTVDFQLADRGVGLVDLKAQEPAND